MSAKWSGRFRVSTQPEGMVADEARGLYTSGRKIRGIWRFQAEPTAPSSEPFWQQRPGQSRISFDVKDFAFFRHLIPQDISWPQAREFHLLRVFERQGANRYLGSFKIGDGPLLRWRRRN
ncbi:MAG: phytase [Haliscomenobacter sp.]|nr:phytase [Haliscomenobacter sp.]